MSSSELFSTHLQNYSALFLDRYSASTANRLTLEDAKPNKESVQGTCSAQVSGLYSFNLKSSEKLSNLDNAFNVYRMAKLDKKKGTLSAIQKCHMQAKGKQWRSVTYECAITGCKIILKMGAE